MFEHVGGEHDIEARTGFWRDALVQIGLVERAGPLADGVQFGHVDTRHMVAEVPKAFRKQPARAPEVEDLARGPGTEQR